MRDIREFASSSDAHEENGQLIYSLARSLEYSKQEDLAQEAYLTASELMKKADTKPALRMAEKLAGAAKRMKLLGNEMELRGKLADGKEFALENYEGKVVLVDFWATWCGPCVAELPNVKKYYELYHDKGFEVVGVCLDSSREKLESFVEAREIPWVNLFEDNAAWDHPVATQYGIMAIPTVILINAEGKVVSLKARGAELGRLLEKELGPVDPDRLKEVEAKLRSDMPSKADVNVNSGQASVPLKQLGLALHNHHAAYKQLPPRKSVHPQLSWRVQMLPFLGEQELYGEFKLDEPWDSEHNLELVKRIPEVFASASPQLGKEGKTRFVFPYHEKAIYRNRELGSKFRDVLDGLSNTIAIVIADEDQAVIWTKPDDLAIDLEAPKKGWSKGVDGKLPILMADGRVLGLSADSQDEFVAGLLTRAERNSLRRGSSRSRVGPRLVIVHGKAVKTTAWGQAELQSAPAGS